METRNYKVTWMKDSQSRIEMEYFNIQGANAMYKALKRSIPMVADTLSIFVAD